jgi:hypothetical protein
MDHNEEHWRSENDWWEFLTRAGYSVAQIIKLFEIRDWFVNHPELDSLEEQHRLEFIRWLIATGRLDDDGFVYG